MEVTEHGAPLLAQTHDCYDATLLLDDAWWQETAGRVKGEVLACVPARHIVLIGGARQPGTIEQMDREAAKVEAGGDHLISSTILVRRGARWEKYEPAAEAPAEGKATLVKRPWWRFW